MGSASFFDHRVRRAQFFCLGHAHFSLVAQVRWLTGPVSSLQSLVAELAALPAATNTDRFKPALQVVALLVAAGIDHACFC